MAIVEVMNLTYSYPAADKPALKDIHFQVEEGEFISIVGANEAGKTSLCFALAGFIPHFFKGELSGEVWVAGKESSRTSLDDWLLNVGLVFQNPFNQISGSKFTVYEEVAFGLENLGVSRLEMKERVERIMQKTGITELAQRSPYALSGGQQQRVALASILVMQPRLLVLDEPTSQLDPIGRREVFAVIKSMSQEGITVVMAEHKLEWVAEFSDRVIALADGEMRMTGESGDVLTSPLMAELGIGVPRYTAAARRAVEGGLLPATQHLPVTHRQARAFFGGAPQ